MIQNIEDLLEARAERRKGFLLTQVSAAEALDDWRVRQGALQHRSGGFFSISGFKDRRTGEKHMLLYQPQGAVNGWATKRKDDSRLFLVQARAEPGNVEEVQYGPTLQSTPANYMQLHGGAASPFANLFLTYDPAVSVVFDTQQLDLGERYALKTKRVSMIETNYEGGLPKGFHWVTPEVLVTAAGLEFVLNTDFKAGLGVLPWSGNPDEGELCPRSDAVRKSLRAPLRLERLGIILSEERNARRILDPVSIEELPNWVISEDGIFEVVPAHNFSVRFFRCDADAREVRSWIQPLIVAHSSGLSVLACRIRNGVLEVYVCISSEIGLATGVGIAPSHVCYPGGATSVPKWLEAALEKPWLETRESDEGGRFHQHSSRYVLAMVPDDCEASEAGVWLNVAELKKLMMVSNMCTIQLRVMASLLLVAS